MSSLSAVDLVKTFPAGRGSPRIRALDGLSLNVRPGTVFALLGPNGAGKSTTVKILTTLSRADSGQATVAGFDVRKDPDQVRRRIGLISQQPSSDPMATVRENLVLVAQIQGMSRPAARTRAAELLGRFQLDDTADRLAKTCSGRTARKLDVAMGLMHRPSVLFLDEPTTGLDPQARAELWHELARLSAQEAVTVLLTTHYLDEADRLADRLAIVDHGRIVVEGHPEQLKSELRGDTLVVELTRSDDLGRAQAVVSRLPGVHDVQRPDQQRNAAGLRARADNGSSAVPAVLAALEDAGIAVAAATVARPSLDDVYLRHVGRSFEVAA